MEIEIEEAKEEIKVREEVIIVEEAPDEEIDLSIPYEIKTKRKLVGSEEYLKS